MGVGFVIAASGDSKGLAKAGYVAFAVLTVFLSWGCRAHRVHVAVRQVVLRQARRADSTSTSVPEREPQYIDFAYISITVGMTFQVSDPEVTSTVMRATILRHALLAYLFGVVIIGVVINVLAGLTK